jgi:TrmH family RNA methyltransferase
MDDLERITSKDNSRLKEARAVRDGRYGDRVFLEGRRLVNEAMLSGRSIFEAFVSDSFLRRAETSDLIGSLASRSISVRSVSDKIFESMTDTKTSQGIIAISDRPVLALSGIEDNLVRPGSIPLVVLLHQINNPSNLGAVIRTASAAGAAGVISSKNSADAFSPRALRGSMGTCFRIPVVEKCEYFDVLSWASDSDLILTAAAAQGVTSYTELDWTKPRLLVMGSEAGGLTDAEAEAISELSAIPMANGVESLNLAVACGIILYEAVRQNRP